MLDYLNLVQTLSKVFFDANFKHKLSVLRKSSLKTKPSILIQEKSPLNTSNLHIFRGLKLLIINYLTKFYQIPVCSLLLAVPWVILALVLISTFFAVPVPEIVTL